MAVKLWAGQAKTASKKIAELEELAKEVRTPGGKGTDRSKSFLSASDQLKASLSAYRSGVAVSSGDTERAPDSGDVRERVRNQLSQMHNSTAKVSSFFLLFLMRMLCYRELTGFTLCDAA
jgi:hypothetical protein